MKIATLILMTALAALMVRAQEKALYSTNFVGASNIIAPTFVFDPETMTYATCYVARATSNTLTTSQAVPPPLQPPLPPFSTSTNR